VFALQSGSARARLIVRPAVTARTPLAPARPRPPGGPGQGVEARRRVARRLTEPEDGCLRVRDGLLESRAIAASAGQIVALSASVAGKIASLPGVEGSVRARRTRYAAARWPRRRLSQSRPNPGATLSPPAADICVQRDR